jgi:hypothetical protein
MLRPTTSTAARSRAPSSAPRWWTGSRRPPRASRRWKRSCA